MNIPTTPIARPTYPAHDVPSTPHSRLSTMIGDIVRVVMIDGEIMIATLAETRPGGYGFRRVAGLSHVAELFIPFGAITSIRRAY